MSPAAKQPSAGEPRSLAADLRARDDEALLALLRARPDLANPMPTDVGQLAGRVATRSSSARALDRLDRFSLQVLDVLAALPEPASYDEVRALLRSDEKHVRNTLDRLWAEALVWGPDSALRLLRTVRELLGPSPAQLGPPLDSALSVLSPARLQGLLADLGLPPTPDPARAVAAVRAHFTERLDDILAEAPEQARAALDTLTWGPPAGQIDGAEREVRLDSVRTPLDWLLARGLLVASGPGIVVLPRELGLHLRGGRVHRSEEPEQPRLDVTRRDPAEVDRAAAGAAASVVRLVEELLDAWSEAPPSVLRAGGLGVRDLRRTAQTLDVPEPDLAVLVETAYAAGLIGSGGDPWSPLWLPTPVYDTWRVRSIAQRWATLATTWLDTTRVAGLVGTRGDRDKVLAALGPELDRSVAPEVRRAVLTELAGLPEGGIAGSDDLLARLTWQRPRRGGRLRIDLVSWTLREAELLGVTGRGALSGPARQLLADHVAGSDRTSAAVAAIEPLLPKPLDHVLLQADLTAIAPGPLETALAHDLRLAADVESTGGATVYRFTDASVRRALDNGRTAGDLLELLERHSRTPVPQPLRYLVEDVGRRHGRIRVGTAGSYIRTDDDAVLAELLAERRAESLGLRRLAPTVLAAAASVDVVLDQLRAMGYAPVAETASGDVVIGRRQDRRSPSQQRPPRLVAEPAPPHDDLLSAVVRAVRAGDRSATAPRRQLLLPLTPDEPPRSPTGDTLSVLRAAANLARPICIGYVDNHGTATERIVEPIRVEGGYLTAYDHRRDGIHTFAVHRITGVAALAEEP